MIGKLTVRTAVTFLFLFLTNNIQAQPLLPDMIGATQNGVNILTWTSQYDVIKSIAVQRSADSFYNYATIGYVKDLKKGPQAFIDGHPLPGKNWYRLYIVFNSDLTWYSNRMKMMVDSQDLLKQKVLPPNDSLQKYVNNIVAVTNPTAATTVTSTSSTSSSSSSGTPVIKMPEIGTVTDPAVYIKSQYVFTNPFTGHVNVEIPAAKEHVFSIKFYDNGGHLILEVPRISEPSIVIDRRNFQRKGIFKFDLMKDKGKLETGYITIY